jgi:flagellar motor switch protein FliM
MTDISQTCDNDSCDKAAPPQDAAAWKSFARKMAGRFPTVMSQVLRGRGQLRGATVLELLGDQFCKVLRAMEYGHMYSWTLAPEDNTGRIWIGIDASGARAMIDVMLGGKPYPNASGSRSLTAIDRRLLGRVVERASGLVAGIAGIQPPLRRHHEAQMHESPAVAAVCFDLDIGGALWVFVDGELCTGLAPGTSGQNPRAKGGPIELSATLNVPKIDADQLAALEVGDVIATDVSVEGEIIVRLAGIPKYIGQLSTVDGKKAITITRKI